MSANGGLTFGQLLSQLRETPVGNGPAGDEPPLTVEDLPELARGLLRFVPELLAPLEQRIAELEAMALTDGGVWSDGVSYPKNAVVTHGGNLWLCKQATNEQPPGGCWRLMNKTKAHR